MTWTVKIRTSPGALMTADYECPLHGRFEATVARDDDGNPPDFAPCPSEMPGAVVGEDGRVRRHPALTMPCEFISPWRISCPPVHTQFVVSATQGKPAPKPHREAMDTRPLAEGRKKEWRQHRKKLREERRHRRLKDYLS
jgi:hypothetical protein